MDCNKIQQRISAYLDNEIPGGEKELISAHIETCRVCGEEFALLLAQRDHLKQLASVRPSRDFRSTFWRNARQTEKAPAGSPGLLDIFLLRWIPVPIAFSIIIVLFSTFTAFSPVLYGVTDSQSRNEALGLAAKTLAGPEAKNVFAPLNFIEFCNNCHHMLCKSCKSGTCDKSCSGCK